MWVLSLGKEDPLEKEMVTHSNILAGGGKSIDRGTWQATVCGDAKESDTTQQLNKQQNQLYSNKNKFKK